MCTYRKSTQVPQLLYEAGLTLGSDQDQKYLIAITQPRRVAAVSTAKRVCYEMGQGDGKTIKSTRRSEGNLVAYQTRYETAGLGDKTGVKFMTDGILLQEIQSDLLLRKYSVIGTLKISKALHCPQAKTPFTSTLSNKRFSTG